MKVRGFDFGYAKPSSVGWYAIEPITNKIYRIFEWYLCKDEPNTGLQMHPHEIAKEIHKIESNEPLLKGRKIFGIADPAIWDESRGESIARMMEKEFVYWTPGDHTRLPGKMQFHYRFAFDKFGNPMFQVFNTCKHFIRTVPMLTYSEKHPEDIDTDEEDHIYDECRYVLMANIIAPRENVLTKIDLDDPLNQRVNEHKKSNYIRI
jgi:hypothetical protein